MEIIDIDPKEFTDFVVQHRPEVLKEYERYVQGWESLKVGVTVKSLKAGFGGSGGQVLVVEEVTKDTIGREMVILKKTNLSSEDRYLLYKDPTSTWAEPWWRCVEIKEDV